MTIRKATAEDFDILVDLRAEVLRAANQLPDDADMETVKAATRLYYSQCLGTGRHTTLLAFAEGRLAACGSVCLYTVMPTCHNPSGRKAYIMNMYTKPAHRRQGIAGAVLRGLIAEAQALGAGEILLEATDMGRPLYEKHGFVQMQNEMDWQG